MFTKIVTARKLSMGQKILCGMLAAMIVSGMVIIYLMYAMGETEDKENFIIFAIPALLFSPIVGAFNPGSYLVGAVFGWISYKVEAILLRLAIQIAAYSIAIILFYHLLFFLEPESYFSLLEWLGVFLGIAVLGSVTALLQLGLEKGFERIKNIKITPTLTESLQKEMVIDESSLVDEQDKVIQINTSYYDEKWSSVQHPEKINTWNWVAFFLSIFWLAHRKMDKWFWGLGLLGVLTLLPRHLSNHPIWGYIYFPFYLLMAIIVGWFGNRWYYNHTFQVLKQLKFIPEPQQNTYLQKKGGTSIWRVLGLSVLLCLFYYIAGVGYYFLPTEVNLKEIVSMSHEGFTLESFTDEPKWTYVKKVGDHHVVEFTGYDQRKKETIHIEFYVDFKMGSFEWKQIYLNGKKLSEKEAEEYEGGIVEGAS